MVRCPKCNKFGKADLGGYCSACKKSKKSNYVRRDLTKAGYGFKTGPAFPKSFGIIRDDCELLDKGE